jgi:hypothetical protein
MMDMSDLLERRGGMEHKLTCLLLVCALALSLLAACSGSDEPVILDTGGTGALVPADVEAARSEALEYVLSVSRLAALPLVESWQSEAGTAPVGEYHFTSAEWHMVVRAAEPSSGRLHVVIASADGRAFWCGYVKPDGGVVETSLTR